MERNVMDARARYEELHSGRFWKRKRLQSLLGG